MMGVEWSSGGGGVDGDKQEVRQLFQELLSGYHGAALGDLDL
jgi:hypothetical protein